MSQGPVPDSTIASLRVARVAKILFVTLRHLRLVAWGEEECAENKSPGLGNQKTSAFPSPLRVASCLSRGTRDLLRPEAPLFLSPRVSLGRCTWCSEGGSELSTVVKSLAIKPADTMPQRSAILRSPLLVWNLRPVRSCPRRLLRIDCTASWRRGQ